MHVIRPPREAVDHDYWSQVALIIFDPEESRNCDCRDVCQESCHNTGPWTIEMDPSEDETDEFRYHITRLFYAWRQRWYWPLKTAARLRTQYSGERERFFRKFRLTDEDAMRVQEHAMQKFVRLERLTIAQIRQQPLRAYWKAGRKALDALGETLATETGNSEMADAVDFVIVSIDFEGSVRGKGVNQYGVAALDTRDLFENAWTSQLEAKIIRCSNYARRRGYKSSKYPFGTSTIIGRNCEALRQIILNSITFSDDRTGNTTSRDVILVSHSLRGTELNNLDALGIRIEELPHVIGLYDTEFASPRSAGKKAWKSKRPLSSTMDALGVPYDEWRLHCAGNDAYYTLQVVLAMLSACRHTVSADGLSSSSPHGLAKLRNLAPQRESKLASPFPGDKHQRTPRKHDAEYENYFHSELFASD